MTRPTVRSLRTTRLFKVVTCLGKGQDHIQYFFDFSKLAIKWARIYTECGNANEATAVIYQNGKELMRFVNRKGTAVAHYPPGRRIKQLL